MGRHFVLIHGAWHGGWAWEKVIERLKAAGHTAEAPDMPGHAPGEDRSGVKFDDYVARIVEVLRKQAQPVILAGHSSAGFLLQAAAPQAADKIERLVFHNAFILADGTSQFDLVPPEASQALTAAAGASPDNSVPVVEDFVRHTLMAGDSQEDQDAVIGRLTPQPLALFTTPVKTAAFAQLPTPKTVLFCQEDTSLPPGAFLGMAQNLGKFDLIEVDGGHESLVVRPEVVAEGLIKAAG